MRSRIEKVTFPATLREIGERVFLVCRRLRTVFVENGCAADVEEYVKDSVEVRRK